MKLALNDGNSSILCTFYCFQISVYLSDWFNTEGSSTDPHVHLHTANRWPVQWSLITPITGVGEGEIGWCKFLFPLQLMTIGWPYWPSVSWCRQTSSRKDPQCRQLDAEVSVYCCISLVCTGSPLMDQNECFKNLQLLAFWLQYCRWF